MKTTLSLFAALPLALAAQETPPAADRSPEPEWDIVERFEQMQREALEGGATERRIRENIRKNLEIGELQEDEDPGTEPERPRRDIDPTMERRLWEMLQREMEPPGRPREDAPDPARMAPPWLIGLAVEPIEPFLRSHFDIPKDSGVRVSMVAPGSPAAQAGIKVNDILLTANGREVRSLPELKEIVMQAGRESKVVAMELLHEGKRTTVSVEPRGPERPQPPKADDGEANVAPQHRMAEMARRLDQQQAEIDKLRREIEQLRERINRE